MIHTKVAIVGSGPAGYTAGIYTGRAQLQPQLFAGEKSGGQLMNTTDIENYPGFAQGKNGPALMQEMRAQAERFGTTIVDKYVTAVDLSVTPFKLWTHFPADTNALIFDQGKPEMWQDFLKTVKTEPHDVEADAVILCLGARSKMLGIPGEERLLGRGVSTCAVCDAAFYRERTTIVVGGGDTAMEDTLALTKFAKSVTLLVRGEQLRASKVMQERVKTNPKVTIRYNTQIQEIQGEKFVQSVVLKTTDGKTETMPVEGVFLAIGHEPLTALVKDQVMLDTHGFIVTRQSPTMLGVAQAQAALSEQGLVTFPTMTSVPGVFAAGDVVDPRYWQAITAAGQGCAAAIDAERWLERR